MRDTCDEHGDAMFSHGDVPSNLEPKRLKI